MSLGVTMVFSNMQTSLTVHVAEIKGRKVAIKKVNMLEDFNTETQAMANLHSPFLVTTVSAFLPFTVWSNQGSNGGVLL